MPAVDRTPGDPEWKKHEERFLCISIRSCEKTFVRHEDQITVYCFPDSLTDGLLVTLRHPYINPDPSAFVPHLSRKTWPSVSSPSPSAVSKIRCLESRLYSHPGLTNPGPINFP